MSNDRIQPLDSSARKRMNLNRQIRRLADSPQASGRLGENGVRPYGIAEVVLSPGWTRTERVLHAFKADEGDRRQIEALRRAGSTPYVGRAVVARPATGG